MRSSSSYVCLVIVITTLQICVGFSYSFFSCSLPTIHYQLEKCRPSSTRREKKKVGGHTIFHPSTPPLRLRPPNLSFSPFHNRLKHPFMQTHIIFHPHLSPTHSHLSPPSFLDRDEQIPQCGGSGSRYIHTLFICSQRNVLAQSTPQTHSYTTTICVTVFAFATTSPNQQQHSVWKFGDRLENANIQPTQKFQQAGPFPPPPLPPSSIYICGN